MKFFVMIMAGMVLVGCGSPSVQLPPTSIGSGFIADQFISGRGKATVHSQPVFQFTQHEPVNLLEEITLAAPKAGEPRKWYRVQVPLDAGLWVHHQFLHNQRIVTIVGNDGNPSPHTYASVKPNRLNVRGGAGDAFPVLGQLPQGTDVALTGTQKGKWLEIFAPGNCSVYVASQFVIRTKGKVDNNGVIKLVPRGDGFRDLVTGRLWEESRNYKLAFDIYLKLAQKGNREAQLKVGQFYDPSSPYQPQNPRGKNHVKAAEWYAKAALQGDPGARNLLAALCSAKQEDPPIYSEIESIRNLQNLRLAREWAKKSCDQGNSHAKKIVSSLAGAIKREELLYAKGKAEAQKEAQEEAQKAEAQKAEAQKARIAETQAELKRIESLCRRLKLERLPENLVDIKITKGNFTDAIRGKLKKFEEARDDLIKNIDFASEAELDQYVKDVVIFARVTKNQNFSDCPPEFKKAYLDAVNQYLGMGQVFRLRPKIDHFLADLVFRAFSMNPDPDLVEATLSVAELAELGLKYGSETENWSKKVPLQKIKIRKASEMLKGITILHGVTYR
jgi:uncharacterized protein YgiM (DUF1202 family)